jgi:prepilin-type N-terminal cleavage/methylation domain-containing protein
MNNLHLTHDAEPTGRHDDKGFTLVEILVAIVLVGILSAVAVLGINGLTKSGGTSACTASMDAAKTATLAYYTTNGAYPTTITQMIATTPAMYVLPSGATLNTAAAGSNPAGTVLTGSNWALTMTPAVGTASPTFACSATSGGAVAQVSATAAGTTACPGTFTNWVGEYYNTATLSGSPVLCRDDASIDFSWATGSPDATINADNFSVRWTKEVTFTAGTYTFLVGSDDGGRLFIDGQLVVDAWVDRSYAVSSGQSTLTAGPHLVVMEFFEHGGHARATLTWS